ncbi:hypothetical protein [Shouchella patagoniensis]|uniref:hypothetical protein n=1 Tax=Shouchella patagoniensis TaxID=228576 RepID=UPI000995AD18|nr:hypothetical protein [Shouchella patagoniensis]
MNNKLKKTRAFILFMLLFLACCMATESVDGEEDQERESPIGVAKNMMDKLIEEDFYAAWSL